MPETDALMMSLCIFVPSIFALGLMLFPKGTEEYMRWFTLLGTTVTLVVSIVLFIDYLRMVDSHSPSDLGNTTLAARAEAENKNSEEYKARSSQDMLSRNDWIPKFNIQYYLGVDGIGMPLILLTTVLFFVSMIASWGISKYVRGYCMLYLILETGVLGTFFALDFFLFYIFWEVMLLPMYFLIGVWGGPRREYAAIKFFLYTLLGSVFILIAMLAFYFTDVRDFVIHSEKTEVDLHGTMLPKSTVEKGKETVWEITVNVPPHQAARVKEAVEKGKGEVSVLPWDASTGLFLTAKKGYVWTASGLVAKQESGAFKGKVESYDIPPPARTGEKGSMGVIKIRFIEDAGILGGQGAETPRGRAHFEQAATLSLPGLTLHADFGKGKEVHTFDLILLARAGKAALRILNGQEKAVIHELSLATGDSEEAVGERLEQPFFTKGFMYTMFLLLFVGFAIKVPVFPFHTWLPDAHVEAPTPISMILAGILLKLGGYGILRIAYPVCPWAAQDLATFLAGLGIINIVYGAFAAMAQTDFKKLVAYSSISHMGYVILGIAVWSASGSGYWSWGMAGAMYQMIGHGVSSAGMFFLVGVIYDRAHHRNLDNFRGLYEPMPLYGGISAVIFFAALGLPGLCGFVGEFMVVLATWNFSKVYAVLAALTVVITAAYILWTVQRVYFGTNPVYKDYKDMNLREIVCIVPLLILCVLLGVAPQLVLSWVEPHLTSMIDSFVAMK